MAALFTNVEVVGAGQSQMLMAGTGGGETVDTPLSGHPVAWGRLNTLLTRYMPGVTVTTSGASSQTWVAATALLRSYNTDANPAFWNDTNQTLDTFGVTLRDYILARASASRFLVMVHYCHSQDASFAAWNDATYASNLAAFYDAIHAACAPGFGRFAILPVPVGSRPTQNNSNANVGAMRRTMRALAGEIAPFAGATARPFVLRPVHTGPYVTVGAYQTSGDFTHKVRSSAWRAVGHVAVRIAGANGFAPPQIDQPRLARAIRLNATTIRAVFCSPARLPLRWQSRGDGFELSTGSVSAVGAPDNTNAAATGYVTMDLTASGFSEGARLFFCRNIRSYADFANGITAPRGQLRSALWADPGTVPVITDAAEDVLIDDAIMHTAPEDAGVPVEF